MGEHIAYQGVEGVDELPPPGDQRRDALKARTDALAEAAETVAPEKFKIDPKALEIENEIAQHFNALEVTGALPEYDYVWTYTGQHGFFIRAKLAQGGEVVQGDMPEAQELKGVGADTTRKLGDVILMRIRKDVNLKLKRQAQERQRRQEEGITGALRQLGEKYRQRGVVIHTDMGGMSDHILKRMANRATAAKIAAQQTDHWLREGRMPGQVAPGVDAE